MSSFAAAVAAENNAGGGSQAIHDAKSNALHAMAKKIAGHFPQVPVISSTELRRKMDDPLLGHMLVVVDVRKPEESEVSMLPGSLTAAEFEARKAELQGKMVVCYCTVGYRSSAYAAKLQQQGFEAKNLEGGCMRWAQKRYPLVTRSSGEGGGETETKRIHAYGKQWALQPADYEAVYFKSPVLATLRSLVPKWLGGK